MYLTKYLFINTSCVKNITNLLVIADWNYYESKFYINVVLYIP